MADIETLGILDEIQALVSDKLQVVSYKWLSRNFLVPSNTAKKLLQEFVEKQGSQLEVLYSLSGWLKNNPSVYHTKLVLSSKLSEAKEEFGDNYSVQVYSVQACIPKDPAVLWNAEFIQAEELFKEPPNVVNCLRDNRFCGVSNSFVKRNAEGTPIVSKASFQEKKVEESNPKPDKGKDNQNGSHRAQVIEQEVKPVPKKDQAPQLPNKKKAQNDKTSSGTSGSLASMWGRASVKPKPESAPVKTDNPIPVSNDAQVLANELEEDDSSGDEDKQMNFKRGSNGDGNNRKRRVVIDYSDEEDEIKDAVSLASPDPPKKQVSVDSKKSSKKTTALENKSLDFDELKEEKVKVSDIDAKNILKEENHDKKIVKPISNEKICPEKDDVEQKAKGSDAAQKATKKRKVLKTRIDERGREVTEVVWEDEEEKETESHAVSLSLSHTKTRFAVCKLQYCPQMVEAQSWTTRRSSNPRFETSVDIPSTPTGEVRYGTTNNIFASFSATSFVSPTILTALIIASWYLSNIGVLLLNKYLLSFYGFKYPIFLTMLHMISCTFYSLIAIRWFQVVPFQQILSRKQFLKIFALSAIFCFSVVCGNTSLRYLPVSFNQAIGATTPFFTAIFAFLITCKKESAEVYLALMPVVFGIVLASNSEPLFHLFGFLMCVGSTAGRALKSVVQGLLLTSDSEKLHSMNLLLYMAPMAAMILLPLTLYIEGNVFSKTIDKARNDSFMVFLLIGNATVAYLVNLTNFLVTKHTSALTLQVLGNAKAAVAAVVSVLIFKNPVNVMGISGFAVTIMGVVLYSEAKKRSKVTAH